MNEETKSLKEVIDFFDPDGLELEADHKSLIGFTRSMSEWYELRRRAFSMQAWAAKRLGLDVYKRQLLRSAKACRHLKKHWERKTKELSA